ncbi:MAG: ABC transporter permease [Lachnospiraceae bacterium]|nr:ABC transporter permease [Lachnospiraceae bacterium]
MALLKINIKLLLRNKAFIFFLLITPVISVFILDLKTGTASYKEEDIRENIQELDNISQKAVYKVNSPATEFIIKVYDASRSGISEHVLKKLASTGMFCVCRLDATEMTEQEIEKYIENDAFNDRAGVILYLKKDFLKGISEGDVEKAAVTYKVSDDERLNIFNSALSGYLGQVYSLLMAGNGEKETLKVLETVQNELPAKEIKVINAGEKNILDASQTAAKSKIGYAFSIITLGFLFCGVCVAFIVIEEQNNKVYTRIMLSGTSRLNYLAAKTAMAVVISLLQTGVLGICLFVTGNSNFGIDRLPFLLIIFMLGLVFCIISLCTGILAGDIMSANYMVFTIWSCSALLSGLYFPLDNVSGVLRAVSFLMPQKWFMEAAEMLLLGDREAYSVLLCVTAAYLIVILSFGGAGLKIKRQDN